MGSSVSVAGELDLGRPDLWPHLHDCIGLDYLSAGGYTKKPMRNIIFMIGYSIGNLISPEIWVPSDALRYYESWVAQIVVSWVCTPSVLLAIRSMLARRNAQRKEWIANLSDDVYLRRARSNSW